VRNRKKGGGRSGEKIEWKLSEVNLNSRENSNLARDLNFQVQIFLLNLNCNSSRHK
jgi:hypothetical protein